MSTKEPRVIIVHSDYPAITGDGVTGSPAHAWGPFESFEAAQAFEDARPDDCFKFVMALVGPDPDDIERASHEHSDEPRVN